MLVERLRKEWHARAHVVPINCAPSFTSDGLVMGAGTVLVPAIAARRLQDLEGQEARVLALLSAAYGRVVMPSVLDSIERAAKRWGRGEDCLALIHLALAGLSRPEDRHEAARRLFMVDGLMKAGVTPHAVLQVLDYGLGNGSFVRYDPAQPRVPEGSGVTSGRWTKTTSVLRTLTRGASEFLGDLAMTGLRVAAANPVSLTLGLILIPRTTNSRVEGDVPELPGFHYDWNRDETRLRLTYAGPNGLHDINATLESDGQFRDGDKVVARLLPDGTLAIDPAEVSSDLADKDGPNLCPKPEPDKYGRGEVRGAKDKDYEDQIKLLVNPDNPTPRGYGYKFWDPVDNKWVYIDDCQHRTGIPVEVKSEYEGLRSFQRGDQQVTYDWLDQSRRQLNATEGFPLVWVFALKSDHDFARELFNVTGDGREHIVTITIPRAAGAPR